MKETRELLDFLAERIVYDPLDGVALWDHRPAGDFKRVQDHKRWERHFVGRRADVAAAGGYRNVGLTVDGRAIAWRAHRVVFAVHTGTWPAGLLDHKDGDRASLVFSNLREATRAENNANSKARVSRSGYRGVYQSRSGRWIAWNRAVGHIGVFDTRKEAAVAFDETIRETYGDFAKTNFEVRL